MKGDEGGIGREREVVAKALMTYLMCGFFFFSGWYTAVVVGV